jgi:hypothetical protein
MEHSKDAWSDGFDIEFYGNFFHLDQIILFALFKDFTEENYKDAAYVSFAVEFIYSRRCSLVLNNTKPVDRTYLVHMQCAFICMK